MSEPKKVYVITQGDYSDYHICAVTLDKELAEKLCKVYSNLKYYPYFDPAQIEEYDLQQSMDDVRIMYRVEIDCGDIEVTEDRYENKEDVFGDKNYFTAYVLARDQEHAVKIAQDRRAEYLAKKEGIV